MPLRPNPSQLGPWALTDEDMLVVEPGQGLREVTVRLGTWRSPDGFPWDVLLVRTDWVTGDSEAFSDEDADEGASDSSTARGEGPTIVARDAPCMLLVPRPWAVPRAGIHEEFAAWQGRIKSGFSKPMWSPSAGNYVWRRFGERPRSLVDLWQDTLRLIDEAEDLPEKQKARQSRLKRIWNHTPWLFVVAPSLIRELSRDLKLPRGVDPADVLLGARGARAAGWLPSDVPERPRHASIQWLRSGAHEALVDRGCTPTASAAFVDGKDDDRSPMQASRSAKENASWRKNLDEQLISPVLVPLTIDGVWDDEPHLDGWATRWLTDGRAHRALWFVFGRTVRHFRWDRVDGPDAIRRRAAGGLNMFGGFFRGLELEPTGAKDYAGWRARWSVDQVEESTGDEGDNSVAPNVGTME
jgi:hypothetical protein